MNLPPSDDEIEAMRKMIAELEVLDPTRANVLRAIRGVVDVANHLQVCDEPECDIEKALIQILRRRQKRRQSSSVEVAARAEVDDEKKESLGSS